jgi:hypothetical protein
MRAPTKLKNVLYLQKSVEFIKVYMYLQVFRPSILAPIRRRWRYNTLEYAD